MRYALSALLDCEKRISSLQQFHVEEIQVRLPFKSVASIDETMPDLWRLLTLFCSYLTVVVATAISTLLPPSSIRLETINASAHDNFTSPGPFPHRFHIPYTNVNMRFWFGVRPVTLDPRAVAVLVRVAQDWVQQEVEERYPAWQYFPEDNDGRQRFGKTLHDGIDLEIWNVGGMRYFTWEMLRSLMEGLRLYLVVGGRNYQCSFTFDIGGDTIGQGRLVSSDDVSAS